MFMHPKHHSSSAAFPTEASIEEKTKTCTDWCHPTYHDDNKLFICASRHIIINTGGKGDRKILNGKRSLGHLHLLLSLAGAATSIIFVVTKVLSWQTRVCHDKKTHLLSQHICLSRQIFVGMKVLLRHACFCCIKRVCHDKTPLLSWQKYACRNKTFVTKIVCCDKYNFVTTNIFSW